MRLEIHSFESIQERAKQPFDPHTALISIGSPDMAPPKLLHKPEHMLRLVFDDITPEEAVERLELSPSLLKRTSVLHLLLRNFKTYVFDDEMAEKAAKFIMNYAPETDVFICQCEYGQSRSAACAAAIAETFGGYGEVVFKDKRYCPNRWVYQKLLAVLQKYAAEKEG